jgi:hypothetical protein
MAATARRVERARDAAVPLHEQQLAFTQLVEESQHLVLGPGAHAAARSGRRQGRRPGSIRDCLATPAQLRDPSAFATWMKTIVARNCARRLRQRTRRAEAVELPRMVGPDTHGVDYQSLITSALATLPEGERDVTVLFYFLGQTEIGRVLHLEPGTVAKR